MSPHPAPLRPSSEFAADRPLGFPSAMSHLQKPSIRERLEQAVALHQNGNYQAAAELYDHVLAEGENANALHLRGLVDHQQGNHAAAEVLMRKALTLQPEAAVIHANLGSALLAQNKTHGAEQAFRAACQRAPQLAGVWRNLAHLLIAESRLGEARLILLQAVENNPKDFECRHLLGIVCERNGQLHQAADAYEFCLSLDANQPRICNDLGSVHHKLGQYDQSVQYFRRATELNSEFAAAWSNLAGALNSCRKHEEAEQACLRAIELNPDSAGANFNYGNVLKDLGKAEQALSYYYRALGIQPQNVDFLLNTASLLNTLGRFDDAATLCRKIISIEPRHARAHYCLFTFTPHDVTDEEVAQLTALLADPSLKPEEKSAAHFSLGKRFDRLEQYDKAFAHFAEANRHSPRRGQFDHDRLRELVDRMQETFTADLLSNPPFRGSESTQPIFILGMPRSGSTLVEQILTSHSQIRGAGECDGIRTLITQHLRPLHVSSSGESLEFPDAKIIRGLMQHQADEMMQIYLQRLQEMGGEAPRLTDKMPSNAFQIGLLQLLFPNATIVYTQRDPRDICLSCYFQNFNVGHEFSFDLRQTAQFYREHVRIMQHWHQVSPRPIHVVEYERLVADQEGESRRLIEQICQLPWEDRCLRFQDNPRAVQTASLWQVRQPIYQKSAGKWKAYATHLAPLFEELGDMEQSAA